MEQCRVPKFHSHRVLGTNSNHKAQMWILEPPVKTATSAYGSAGKMFLISPNRKYHCLRYLLSFCWVQFSLGKQERLPMLFPCPIKHQSWRQQYQWTTSSKHYLPKSGSDMENPLLMKKRFKKNVKEQSHAHCQIYPKYHSDGKCPGPYGTEIRLLHLCSDWLYPIQMSSFIPVDCLTS